MGVALGMGVVKTTGTYRGLLVALALGLLAVGAAGATAWSRLGGAPEHGAQVRTGIICGTPSGDCVVPVQLVGATCSCPGAERGRTGVVLPESAARGG